MSQPEQREGRALPAAHVHVARSEAAAGPQTGPPGGQVAAVLRRVCAHDEPVSATDVRRHAALAGASQVRVLRVQWVQQAPHSAAVEGVEPQHHGQREDGGRLPHKPTCEVECLGQGDTVPPGRSSARRGLQRSRGRGRWCGRRAGPRTVRAPDSTADKTDTSRAGSSRGSTEIGGRRHYLLSLVRGPLAVLHDALVQRRLEPAALVGRRQQRAQPGVGVGVAVSEEVRVAGGDGRGDAAVGGRQEGALPAVRLVPRAVLGRDPGVALRAALGRVEVGGPHRKRVPPMDSFPETAAG